ncbi:MULTISPECIES: cytochrome P450 [unclassified Parafrankia]|uniref:cytochrome P450 n=1 Tax=unclassified Parafrankia TaxID=2994368 RepID=UPI000DD4DB4A|nr:MULTISPECIES: cytochrome P450 [unclassified Parafrankia]TCJ31341.1 cytochrome P450 [Parafrankia sp. BMG5.11]
MTDAATGQLDAEWVEHHFDHLSPELARDLHPTLALARSRCPVAHSDQYDGFWVVTGYEDVLRVAQDWETFSSELGITVPYTPTPMKILPVTIDPPLQRTFKRLINTHFRPVVVVEWEQQTRALVNRLIDGFVEAGECDFMTEFARPLPGLAFFDMALHAPAEDLEMVNHWATLASLSHLEESRESHGKLAAWIGALMAKRREEGPRGDVVDAVMNADIEGRPITPAEAVGTVQLLVLGGLETTAGALGMSMIRFCRHPEILARLRENPELIPDAVEELLRLDGSFICIARTARHDTELGGRQIKAGERVLIYWASANRDESEFDNADTFDLDRGRNRHIAFGAGPHRCAGSNLARMNLRIALEEIVTRLVDVRLQPGADIDYHSTFNRAPQSVPITFTPGPRLTPAG